MYDIVCFVIRINAIMCAQNTKNTFKFVKVIHGSLVFFRTQCRILHVSKYMCRQCGQAIRLGIALASICITHEQSRSVSFFCQPFPEQLQPDAMGVKLSEFLYIITAQLLWLLFVYTAYKKIYIVERGVLVCRRLVSQKKMYSRVLYSLCRAVFIRCYRTESKTK